METESAGERHPLPRHECMNCGQVGSDEEKRRQAEVEPRPKTTKKDNREVEGTSQEVVVFEHSAVCEDTAFGTYGHCTVTVTNHRLRFVSHTARKYSFELSQEKLAQANLRAVGPDKLEIEVSGSHVYTVALTNPVVNELVGAVRTTATQRKSPRKPRRSTIPAHVLRG